MLVPRQAVLEALVKHHHAAAALEAVTPEAQLRHGVDVGDAEFDGGPVGRGREPQVEVLGVLARFQEEDVVAGVEVGEGIEGRVVVVVGFGVEFGVFVGVGEERGEVVEEVPLSVVVRGGRGCRGSPYL